MTILIYLFLYLSPQMCFFFQLCISLFSTMYIYFPSTICILVFKQFFFFNSIILSCKQHLFNNTSSNLPSTIYSQPYTLNYSHLTKHLLRYVLIYIFSTVFPQLYSSNYISSTLFLDFISLTKLFIVFLFYNLLSFNLVR